MSIGSDLGIWTGLLGGAMSSQQAPRGLGQSQMAGPHPQAGLQPGMYDRYDIPTTAFYNPAEDSVLADRYRHLRSTFELGPEEFDKLVLSSMEGKPDEPAKG